MSAAKARANPLQAIENHLREQQCRVYHVAQSVEVAMKAIEVMDKAGENHALETLRGALSIIQDTLNDIGREIDEGATKLEREVSHD